MSLKSIQGMIAYRLQGGFGGIYLILVVIWALPPTSFVSLNLSSFRFLICKAGKTPDLPAKCTEDMMRDAFDVHSAGAHIRGPQC